MKSAVLAVIALVVGLAGGYALAPSASAPTPVRADVTAPKRAIADVGTEASIDALRRRVAMLEKELAAARADRPATGEVARVDAPKDAGRPNGFMDFRRHLEELKKTNPKRYAEITNNFARMRSHQQARAAGRLDFLASVDTSRMSADARETHEALQDLIVRREELQSRMQDENLSGEDRAKIMNEMRDVFREMHRLNEEERSSLLTTALRNAGVKGSTVTEAAETIRNIIDATQEFGGRMPPPPGPPPQR